MVWKNSFLVEFSLKEFIFATTTTNLIIFFYCDRAEPNGDKQTVGTITQSGRSTALPI